MKFHITLKKRSSSKSLGSCVFEFENVHTLKDLLTHILLNELHKDHNVPFLNQEELHFAAALGKVCFDEMYNQHKISDEEALDIMFQAFQDSLIRVFVNQTEYTHLEDRLPLKADNDIVIIRMLMLAGRR